MDAVVSDGRRVVDKPPSEKSVSARFVIGVKEEEENKVLVKCKYQYNIVCLNVCYID